MLVRRRARRLARRLPPGVRHHAVGDADRGRALPRRVRARRGRVRARTSATSRCATRRCSTCATGCARRRSSRPCCAGCAPRSATLGIRYGVILCGIRSLGPSRALRIAELCVAFKNRGVVGFDLAGAEYNHPAKLHRHGVPARDRQQHQLHRPRGRVVRARVGPPGDPRVRRASHRPRHAARRERRPAQLRQRSPHPARGLPVVERADARGGELGDPPGRLLRRLRPARDDQHRQPADVATPRCRKELHLCHQHYGWSLATIKEIIIAGFKSAFMPYREKADLVAEISRELATFEDPRGEVSGPRRPRRVGPEAHCVVNENVVGASGFACAERSLIAADRVTVISEAAGSAALGVNVYVS